MTLPRLKAIWTQWKRYPPLHMMVPRLKAIWTQWKRYPPLHMMVGSYLGYGKAPKVAQNVPLDGLFNALASEGI